MQSLIKFILSLVLSVAAAYGIFALIPPYSIFFSFLIIVIATLLINAGVNRIHSIAIKNK